MSDFTDRMKSYEQAESGRRFENLKPVIARIDGRSFSRLTRDMNKPFDDKFSDAMIYSTIQLVKETNACIGYTQSDEITLIFYSESIQSQIWFDRKIQKMTSLLAAHASIYFYKALGRLDITPTFDARTYQVPNKIEACNVLRYREGDAIKNSIGMAARSIFSHKELLNKSTIDQLELMKVVGVDWNDYRPHFKRGSYIKRQPINAMVGDLEVIKRPATLLEMPLLSSVDIEDIELMIFG